MKAIKFGLLSVVLLAACSPRDCGPTTAPTGISAGIVILVDFSESFAPYGELDKKALRTLGDAATSLATRLSPPVKLQWAPIVADSRRAGPICGGPRLFQQSMTNLGQRSVDAGSLVTSRKDLETWARDVCPDVLVETSKKARSPYTDITGAIAMAADSLTEVSESRILFIYSDFLEDKPLPSVETLRPLDGFRVVLVWRAGLDSMQNMDQRLERWSAALKASGVPAVCIQPAASLLAVDVVSCVMRAPNVNAP